MDNTTIKSYKGFNKDMTCRGFQYEEGREYEEADAEACNKGFHACEMPLDVFRYYKPSESIYHEVEQSGEISRDNEDTKIASSKIKIGAAIGIKGLVNAQVKFVREKASKADTKTTSGNSSSAATSGDRSSAATSGYRSSAAAMGKNSIALANGKDSRAKAAKGNYIVLTEYDDNYYEMVSAKMVKIDGKRYKADTWYMLKDEEVVEWEE